MGKDYGEPIRYDPNFNGPIHNRSCTDILLLIAFILFLGLWGFIGYYGIQNGDIDNLLAPMDSEGHRCGLDSHVRDKRYLVFFDITKCLTPGSPITGCPTKQVCVSQCPTQTHSFDDLSAANLNEKKRHMVCAYNIDIQSLTLNEAINHVNNEQCAKYVVRSQPVLDRCFPDVTEAKTLLPDQFAALVANGTEQVVSAVTNLVQFDQLSAQIVQDLVQSRWYLLGALVAVVVLCFVYILLLRWVVAPVVWASILGLIALLSFSLYLCYKNYDYFRLHPVILNQTSNLKGYAESIFSKKETWMVLLIVIAVVLLILVLIVIFLRKRITIAIALIQEGSKAVSSVKTTVLFPIFPWVLQCFVIAYGVLVLMYLLSVGEPAFKVVNLANDTNCECQVGSYTQDYVQCSPIDFLSKCHFRGNPLRPCDQAVCHFTGLDSSSSRIPVPLLHLLNVLAFFWTMFFISGVADMMLASTFSTWYWTYHKRDLPFFTLTAGIYRTLRYHLGTVAFGALIIAIVRTIRVILEYIDHKIKKFDNPFTRCIMCCCKCFFWCLENFLKFINKNAYIMCAVHGSNFCNSARDAFALLMRNIIRVVVLDKVTDFLFFLSKLLISIGVGISVYYLLQWSFVYEVTQGQQLHYNYIPAGILGIATYLISTIFFNVYQMAVDTLFLCFLEDCERNDGSPEKPYFMSKNLMKILGKKNKQ